MIGDRPDRRVVVASNRGPVTFVEEEGELVPRRGAGGLVTALWAAVQSTGGAWMAAAMTEGDRRRAALSPDGRIDLVSDDAKLELHLMTLDPESYDRFYNEVSNRFLWFLHHHLWDVPRSPVVDTAFREAWEAYRGVNRAFAEALAERCRVGERSILVQDYHLSLAPAMLRALAPEARIAHFHHVPFAGPDSFELLPRWLREEILGGLLGADLLGFQTRRWADRFLACSRLLDGAEVGPDTVRWRGRTAAVRVYPISVDAGRLREAAAAPEVARERRELAGWLGDRRLLLRVDRTEPSKNVLRGFLAYEDLLRRYPAWRERVVFLALLNPSRRGLPEYRAYIEDCLTAAGRINEAFGTDRWTPVDVRVEDDYPAVLAALGVFDALLVNPLFDGMNLVAKEGAVLNGRDGVLLLSRNAGAFAELGSSALPLDPLDVSGTADAVDAALRMLPVERARRAEALRRIAASRTPAAWVERQLDDLAALTEDRTPGP